MKVAIIGAGMTGASAASSLGAMGIPVQVFDKGRGVGGRMSSKRLAETDYVDMGAQYFTARDADFKDLVAKWQEVGVAALWHFTPSIFTGTLQASPDNEQRFVGVPTMQQPIKHLLADVDVTTSCRINNISQDLSGLWLLTADDGREFSGFSYVLVTTPPSQAAELLQSFPELLPQLPTAILQPCWAVTLTLSECSAVIDDATENSTGNNATGIFCQNGNIRWACQLQDKPGRQSTVRWLVHFSAEFTRANLSATLAELTAYAKSELSQILNYAIVVSDSISHRWLYATVDAKQSPPGVLCSSNQQIWLAGDWSLGGRIENAWLAGQFAAKRISAQLQP